MEIGEPGIITNHGEYQFLPTPPIEGCFLHSLLPENTYAVGQLRVADYHHSPFPGGDDLSRVKTETCGYAMWFTDPFMKIHRTHRAGCVLNDGEVVGRRDGKDFIQIGWQADLVDRQDRACAWRNGC